MKLYFHNYVAFLCSLQSSSQYAAARAWTKWEMMTAHLIPNEDNVKRGDDDYFSLVGLIDEELITFAYWPFCLELFYEECLA